MLHPSGVALVKTTDTVGFAARLESVRASSNGLSMKVLERHQKGKSTGESFGGVGSPMVAANGEGQLVLAARAGRKLSAFALEDELCFVREEVLLGFDGELTFVVAVALLLPGLLSADAVVTEAVLASTVPAGVAASTPTTSVNTALPAGSVAIVHVTVPVPPTAGVVHDQPAGDASEVNVVFAGSASVSATVVALLGPLFATVIV